jgi:hypothetical protein
MASNNSVTSSLIAVMVGLPESDPGYGFQGTMTGRLRQRNRRNLLASIIVACGILGRYDRTRLGVDMVNKQSGT